MKKLVLVALVCGSFAASNLSAHCGCAQATVSRDEMPTCIETHVVENCVPAQKFVHESYACPTGTETRFAKVD